MEDKEAKLGFTVRWPPQAGGLRFTFDPFMVPTLTYPRSGFS